MLVPVLPLYLTEEGISVALIGVILGATGIGAGLGGLPIGALIARFGENKVMLGTLSAVGLSTALLGVTNMAIALIVLRTIFGAGIGGMRLASQTWITRRVEDGMRGRALATVGGSTRFGLFLGPLIGGVLADLVGFSATFMISGAMTTVGLMALLRTAAESSEIRDGFRRAPDRPGILRALRKHRKLLARTAVVPLLIVSIREGRQTVLPLIGEDLELSATAVGALVAVSAGADLILFPVSGFLMDRYGRLFGMVPAFGLVGLGLAALGWAWFSDSLAGVVLAGVLVGIGNGMSAGSMLTLGSDLAPPDATSEFLAGMAALGDFGRVVGPIVVGVVAASMSLGAAAITLAIMAMLAIVWLVLVIGETGMDAR
ncbi:MAG: MFS family permease [Verrucomicrobiales bacterium]|jgi:MFS family permease